MKNSFKFGALALIIAISVSACGGTKAPASNDSIAKVDSTKKDTVAKVDSTKKDTTKKDTTKKK